MLLDSVVGLFREDAGTHDPTRDVEWPVREGPTLVTLRAALAG